MEDYWQHKEPHAMTLLVTGYKTKKELKASIGQPLKYRKTSIFGEEYTPNGSFVVARRPHMLGGGREFFARVTMREGKIEKVE
jgi:hypothetical protein